MSTEQFWDKGIMLVDGCTKVSPGCKNCWSEAMTARFKRVPEVLTDGRFNGSVQFNLHLLEKAAKRKEPTVYAIWNDLYHEGVTLRHQRQALTIMGTHEQHRWLIVTKRPENALEIFKDTSGILHHIWHIVTCENQEQADKRIPHLLKIPGKRGIIIEPMLGPVDLSVLETEKFWQCPACGDWCLKEAFPHNPQKEDYKCICDKDYLSVTNEIHQVILGPENGTGKRPFNPAWAESIKAQCEAVGVPYYRKDKSEGVLAWRR